MYSKTIVSKLQDQSLRTKDPKTGNKIKIQGHNFGIMIFFGEFDQWESVNHFSRS